MKPLNESAIIICGIVRNAESGLKRNIPVINALCDQAKDYKIVVYENDSKDKTKQILKQWAIDRGKNNVHVLLNDNAISEKTIPSQRMTSYNPVFSSQRIEKMVFLRNQYLSYIRQKRWEADYVIVVDLDVAQLFLKGILSSFEINLEWDAITAYGYSYSRSFKKRYHDTYPLIELNDLEPQTTEKIRKNRVKYGKLKYTDKPIKVFSAFGGLAIYRYEVVKDISYQLIFNQDDKVEVCCEHQSIYFQMYEKGYTNVFINPQMYLLYERISLKHLFEKLRFHYYLRYR